MSDRSISVIIPCFNSQETIFRALESVRSQTHPPTEILVYDDASSDNTHSILTKYSHEHPQVTVYRSETNNGAGFGRQFLLDKTNTEYIAFLDADDEWHPKKLEVQLEAMNFSNADICICDYQVINDNGKEVGIRRVPKNVSFRSLHLANWIPTSMVLFRKDITERVIMSNLRTRQDYAYWLMIFKKNPATQCVGINQVLGTYHRNSNGLSGNIVNNIFANYRVFRVVLNYSKVKAFCLVIGNILFRLSRV